MKTTNPSPLAVLAAAFAISSIAAPRGAEAASLAALLDGKTVAIIDTDAKKVTSTATIAGGARLVGIDVRPADGKLYGLTDAGTLVVLDARSGKWERKSQLSERLPAGARITVDFNPVADRMRVLGSDGTSLRINVEDGKAVVDGRLRYADADAMKGTPRVLGGAYANSIAGTKETTLFDIDAAAGTLVRQAPPNDGVLNTIGKLGIQMKDEVGFDIRTDAQGNNAAWLLTGGVLYSVDLATGAGKRMAKISGLKGNVLDMAVLP